MIPNLKWGNPVVMPQKRPYKWPDLSNWWTKVFPQSRCVVRMIGGERVAQHIPMQKPWEWLDDALYGFKIKTIKP